GTYTGKGTPFRQCRDSEIERLMAELIWDKYEDPNWELCHRIVHESINPVKDRGLVPVWSWESLIENSHRIQRLRAENMKKALGECRIIVTVRHPFKLVESLYLQLLKRDNVGSHARYGSPVRYQSLDEWLTETWETEALPPRVHLEYAKSIQMFAEVFGQENVGLFLFEDLVNDPEEYYRSICEFTGVDATSAWQHVSGEKQNQRWTVDQIERLKSINESFVKSLKFQYSTRGKRKKRLGILENNERPTDDKSGPAKAVLSDEWRTRIEEKTADGNRQLAEQWQVPLQKYDYPMP
ncbi:MAG: sulfotransferase, partial [Planctomycetaceae bacterium]|nr:sulfotransferase [Planctomycetaceae bacterium]